MPSGPTSSGGNDILKLPQARRGPPQTVFPLTGHATRTGAAFSELPPLSASKFRLLDPWLLGLNPGTQSAFRHNERCNDATRGRRPQAGRGIGHPRPRPSRGRRIGRAAGSQRDRFSARRYLRASTSLLIDPLPLDQRTSPIRSITTIQLLPATSIWHRTVLVALGGNLQLSFLRFGTVVVPSSRYRAGRHSPPSSPAARPPTFPPKQRGAKCYLRVRAK
jgi:hypothetical protein